MTRVQLPLVVEYETVFYVAINELRCLLAFRLHCQEIVRSLLVPYVSCLFCVREKYIRKTIHFICICVHRKVQREAWIAFVSVIFVYDWCMIISGLREFMC